MAATILLVATGASAACREAPAERHEWRLVESLRLGGAEEGPNSFDYIKGIAADSAGRMFVYDRSTQDIRVFTPDGAFERVIGRVGSGPGEMRDAEGIVLTSDGRLWVRDAANARFTIFSAAGEFERTWQMQFCGSQGMWDPRIDPAGRIIDEDCIVSGDRAVGEAALAYHTDLSRVDTIAAVPSCGTPALAEAGTWITKLENGMRYQSIPFRAIYLSVLGSRGELWCVPNASRYEIVRLMPGAADTARITRQLEPVPVTSRERDSVIADIEAKGPTGLDFNRIPQFKPLIDRLTVDDHGRLWVRRTNDAGEVVFDIFDTAGAPLASAVLGRYRTSVWRPFVVRGDNVYAVILGTDDVEQVVRFSIAR
ncbi:MAG: 6-bladed beta-propeller [Gemmatimonadetes bacterium]|nr:6-bladed beta-propeller [Gemmatimonadota bacterium]